MQYNESWAIFGSCIATFAVVFPSFILMVIISRFFLKYQKHPVVEAVFKGLRPAVVGLLAAAALVLMNAEKLRQLSNRFVSIHHQYNYFSSNLYRYTEIQNQSYINDYTLRSGRVPALLRIGRLWEIIKKIRMIGSGNNHQLFVITD